MANVTPRPAAEYFLVRCWPPHGKKMLFLKFRCLSERVAAMLRPRRIADYITAQKIACAFRWGEEGVTRERWWRGQGWPWPCSSCGGQGELSSIVITHAPTSLPTHTYYVAKMTVTDVRIELISSSILTSVTVGVRSGNSTILTPAPQPKPPRSRELEKQTALLTPFEYILWVNVAAVISETGFIVIKPFMPLNALFSL